MIHMTRISDFSVSCLFWSVTDSSFWLAPGFLGLARRGSGISGNLIVHAYSSLTERPAATVHSKAPRPNGHA
jgi:hypothetical protein